MLSGTQREGGQHERLDSDDALDASGLCFRGIHGISCASATSALESTTAAARTLNRMADLPTAEPAVSNGRRAEHSHSSLRPTGTALDSSNHPTGEGEAVADSKSDILQGTLDLMVLKTLDAMGPMHGYGIARRIEQISEEALQINQGTIYLCLIRLVQKGWIDSAWGTSENNRKAKFYSISKAGKKQLMQETRNWERVAGVIDRVLNLSARRS